MAERPSGYEAPARPVGPGDLPRVPDGPAQGAVRRTPRPTGDRQTPETAPQESAGTTQTGGSVSEDAGNATDDLSPEVAAALTEQHGPELEALADLAQSGLDQLRDKLADAFQGVPGSVVFGHLHTTDNDMQAFVELPDCLACGGTGKDQHGTPFEAHLAWHFAGPPIKAEGRRRQLCMWCGHVLTDLPSRKDETLPDALPVGWLVFIEDGAQDATPYTGGELPPGCCALPDDGEPVCICTVESTPCPDCRDEDQADDDVPVDPDDGYPVDLCGKHTGNCSNRCLLPAHHAGECDDDPGPDEAQETRAAADWPAEPVDTPAEGDHV